MSAAAHGPAIAGTAVLGTKLFAGQRLAATGIAIGVYIAIGAGCLIAGGLARLAGMRNKTGKGIQP